jgi:CBS domain-containing protein
MPSIIQNLIPEKQKLVTVTENDSAQKALLLMIEYDFSQLPVIASDQTLKGMITSDSILRAVSNLKVIPERFRVSHAITKITPYRMEDALSELLKGLQSTNAIPIIDSKNNIEAIVTSYDTAEYFRRRAEDLMLAEDIELNLRDFIKPSNASDPSSADDDKISQLIEAITPSNNDLKAKFKSALLSYIAKTTGNKPKLDQTNFDSVFEQYLARPIVQRTFDDLTLYELTQIFKKLWSQYQSGFNDLEWDAIEPLLEGIRETRNAIAHFREVSPHQRRQLQYCVSLLDNHKPSFELPETDSVTVEATTSLSASENLLPEALSFSPLEEEVEANDSRYAPLAIWLQTQEADRITCTFKEIETIIHDELPPSARQHRNWWANDTVSHTQSAQWLEVGWRVSSINMSTERVVFSRMGDRQSAYIDFFSRLQAKLQSIKTLSITPQNNQQGRSWLVFAISSTDYDSTKSPYIAFSFSRGSRFRIEIYINEREQSKNKQIFDQLQAQKAEIEAEFGAALSWERLDYRHSSLFASILPSHRDTLGWNGHGSRIAYYRPDSSITDSPEKLDEMQDWAVEILPKFYTALSDRFIAAQKQAIPEENR